MACGDAAGARGQLGQLVGAARERMDLQAFLAEALDDRGADARGGPVTSAVL